MKMKQEINTNMCLLASFRSRASIDSVVVRLPPVSMLLCQASRIANHRQATSGLACNVLAMRFVVLRMSTWRRSYFELSANQLAQS